MTTKMMIRFFTIADYEEEEAWLRRQHSEGWKLKTMIPPCIYFFEECEPEDVFYRLDYRNRSYTEEYLRMMEDFGWEYFARCFGWLYFRKPADAVESEEEGELFSDGESRVEMANHIVKTRLIPLAVIFLTCIMPNFMRYGIGSIIGRIFGVLFMTYVFLIVYCGIKLKKIKRRYSNEN